MEKLELQKYWNRVYTKKEVDTLGWYEENPIPSLTLIEKCELEKDSHILNVGTGASTLIDHLLELSYENITATDISSASMDKLKTRLGEVESNKVNWIVDDLTLPTELLDMGMVDLWHDRAVLHFLTEESEQNTYFDLLKNKVKSHGYVIIAAFNLEGATMCSGLPVYRYELNTISNKLGKDFTLVDSFDYTYTMPSGDTRAYIYTLFRRE